MPEQAAEKPIRSPTSWQNSSRRARYSPNRLFSPPSPSRRLPTSRSGQRPNSTSGANMTRRHGSTRPSSAPSTVWPIRSSPNIGMPLGWLRRTERSPTTPRPCTSTRALLPSPQTTTCSSLPASRPPSFLTARQDLLATTQPTNRTITGKST